MRFLYNLAIYLAAIPGLALQFWRNRRIPGRRARLAERLGFGSFLAGPTIWIHAVSVGEMQAAAPLVRALLVRYPQYPVVLSTLTPTGADRARQLFGEAVLVRYVPIDLPGAVRRFFDRVRPRLALILETELWPNLYAECGRRDVPLVLASARISPRSVGSYRRLVPLFRQTLSHGIIIAAQSERDAARFLSIGAAAERTHVTGNIKFDFELPAVVTGQGRDWRRAHAPQRPVWVAGSTHEGEEALVLDAHRQVREKLPAALLVLVPRHTQRFAPVRELLARRGETSVNRSDEAAIGLEVGVLLGDTMGDLMTFYAGADVAFVGGSLVPVGGHNLLEPAAVGCPVLTGPHCFNADAVLRLLVEAGAARVVRDSRGLARQVIGLLGSDVERQSMGAAGRRVLDENRGSLGRLLRLMEPLLEPDGPDRVATG